MSLSAQQVEMIDEIMDEFDFERVHRAMTVLNLSWTDREGDPFVIPSIGDLRREARRILQDCIEDGYAVYATRWFEAYWDQEFTHLQLKFVLTEWSAERRAKMGCKKPKRPKPR